VISFDILYTLLHMELEVEIMDKDVNEEGSKSKYQPGWAPSHFVFLDRHCWQAFETRSRSLRNNLDRAC
jgi:hypothetical protein